MVFLCELALTGKLSRAEHVFFAFSFDRCAGRRIDQMPRTTDVGSFSERGSTSEAHITETCNGATQTQTNRNSN